MKSSPGGEPVEPERSLDPKVLWLLSGCAFASMVSMRVCDAMLPALGAEFGAGSGPLAQTISAFALAYGLLQLFYGPLGDRYGKARLIAYATLACTLGSLAAALSPSLEWLVASRVLSGMAAAGILPLTMAWIGDHVPYGMRQQVLAQLLGATVMGMICGQWAGGLLSEWLDWRVAFALLVAVFLFAGVGLLQALEPLQLPEKAMAPLGMWGAMRVVLARPWARFMLLAACAEGVLAFGALAFIPWYLHARFDLPMSAAGGLVALYGLGGFLYSRCAPWLLARLDEPGLARLGALCLGMAYATLALAPSWTWAVPACLAAGFGFYALHNTLQVHATQMAPAARGTAVSMFVCVLFVGQSLGIQVSAWIIDRHSPASIFLTAALGLWLLGTGFAEVVKRRQSPQGARA